LSGRVWSICLFIVFCLVMAGFCAWTGAPELLRINISQGRKQRTKSNVPCPCSSLHAIVPHSCWLKSVSRLVKCYVCEYCQLCSRGAKVSSHESFVARLWKITTAMSGSYLLSWFSESLFAVGLSGCDQHFSCSEVRGLISLIIQEHQENVYKSCVSCFGIQEARARNPHWKILTLTRQ